MENEELIIELLYKVTRASMCHQWHYFLKESEQFHTSDNGYVWTVLWCDGANAIWKQADLIVCTRKGEWGMMGS
jgi:hypothetical protein